jgi:lipopolysaccharide biosynthesis glycosyltransferase
MMSFLSQKEWEEILAKVYKKAAWDHEFHQICLIDAHFAILEATGKKISKEIKIRFVDENDQFVLSLPPFIEAQKKKQTHSWDDEHFERIAEKLSRMLVCI